MPIPDVTQEAVGFLLVKNCAGSVASIESASANRGVILLVVRASIQAPGAPPGKLNLGGEPERRLGSFTFPQQFQRPEVGLAGKFFFQDRLKQRFFGRGQRE